MKNTTYNDILKKYGYSPDTEDKPVQNEADPILAKYGYAPEQPVVSETLPPEQESQPVFPNATIGPSKDIIFNTLGSDPLGTIARLALSKTAAGVGRGLTLGALDLEKGTVFGKPVLNPISEVLEDKYVPEELARNTWLGLPAEIIGGSAPYGAISRGVAGTLSKAGSFVQKMIQAKNTGTALSTVVQTVTTLEKPGATLLGRFINAGITGGVGNTITALNQGGSPKQVAKAAEEGLVWGVGLQSFGEAIHIIAKTAGAINKIAAYRKAVDNLAKLAYGEGRFNSLEEAREKIAQVMDETITVMGGIDNVSTKDARKLNKSITAILKKKAASKTSVEPINVTPEPQAPVELLETMPGVDSQAIKPQKAPQAPGGGKPQLQTPVSAPKTPQIRPVKIEVGSSQTPVKPEEILTPQKEESSKIDFRNIKPGDTIYDDSGRTWEVTKTDQAGFGVKSPHGAESFVGINHARLTKPEAKEPPAQTIQPPSAPEKPLNLQQKQEQVRKSGLEVSGTMVTEKAATNEGEPKVSFRAVRKGDSFIVTEWVDGKKGTTYNIPAEEYLKKSNFDKAKYIESIHKTQYDGFDQYEAIHSRVNDAFGWAIDKANKNVPSKEPLYPEPKTGVTSFKLENGKLPFEPVEFGAVNDKGYKHQVFRVSKVNGLYNGDFVPASVQGEDLTHKPLSDNLQAGDIVTVGSNANMRIHENIYRVKNVFADKLDVEEISKEKAIELLKTKDQSTFPDDQNQVILPKVESSKKGDIIKPEGEKYGRTVEPEQVPTDQIRSDGAGTLEKVPAKDVPGSQAVREPVKKSVRGSGASEGSQGRADREGTESRPGGGDRSERLHYPATRKAESRTVKRNNYVITEKDQIGTGTEGERLRNNLEAIKTLKKIMSENRQATPEEQAALVKYVGWGGLANVFNERMNDGQMAKAREELKQLLTKEEYESAQASVKNAHYTSPEVIKAIYDGIKHLGFNRGYVLEPAAGVGHFIGLMPEKMAGQSNVTGIELDTITGNIAKYLYPDSDIRVTGFEKAGLSPIYDLAVSNVPFGSYAVYDEKIPKPMRQSIHNYFFAKALETVRPGGLIVFITSRYTMDARPNTYASESENANARRYISNRANFLGAIRLPYTAFKGNAGTEVVTDIIVLQKKGEGVLDKGQEWLNVKLHPQMGYHYTNEYYHEHPEMVLGNEAASGTMYGSGQYNVEPTGENLGEAIAKAFKRIPSVYRPKVTNRLTAPKTNELIPAPGDLKEGSFKVQDGKLYRNRSGSLSEITAVSGEVKRIVKQIELVDLIKENMRLQYSNGTDEQLKQSQQKMNRLYDSFVKEYGYLHERKNSSKFSDDPEFPRLLSIENWDAKSGKATKADIFSKRTIQKYEPPTKAENSHEALIYSLNEHGFVDPDYMAELTGKPADEIISDLGDAVYQNPDSKQWETADAYLSGNVRVKLKIAENYAKLEKQYRRNVEALKKVIPKDVMPAQIKVRLGATWIPIEAYQEFVKSIFGSTIEIKYSSALGEWKIGKGSRYGSLASSEYGTANKDFYELFRLALNQQKPQVFDTHYDGEKEYKKLNQEKTLAAIAKQEKIQKAFEDWIWQDQKRADVLTKVYNDTNNSIVLRSWDGSHMTFPGINPVWASKLRPHQKNAIWRGVQGGNCLLAHAVGAGKTFEQIAIGMELKRLGIVRKMVWSVPKHLVKQSADSALDLYPGAKILMAGDKSFGKDERKEFMNKIATGDWDLIVISHNNLKSIPLSETAIREHYRERIDQLTQAINEEVEAGTRSEKGLVKNLETAKARLQTRLDEEVALIKKNQDVGNISWEETGIDGLMVDEAHLFKNLFFHTKMEKVSGLGDQKGTQKTTDLYMKLRHLQRLNGGRGIVFATGTPIANSIAELYHMQRYLQPGMLEERGITNFDSWVAQFAQVTPELEMKPTGQGYRLKDRLSSFINLPELKQMFRTFSDIQTAEMLKLPVPDISTGKPEEIAAEPRPELLDYIQTLAERAKVLKGKPEKGGDNMLKISGDGRKASLDMRLINPALPDDPGSKINLTVDKVVEIYNETASVKGTQAIFLDLSTPGKEAKQVEDEVDTDDLGLSDDEKALKVAVNAEAVRVYNDIKKKLIAKGIPAQEISFIHDAKTIESRRKFFDDMNSGKLRVILGSTGKLGTGANIQERLIALYNLDAPWKPAEVEQRVGRILRQGNKNETVHVFNCITKKSFDARTWHILKMKDRFIRQLMNDDMSVREIGDATGDAVLNFAEVAAIASDNPDIIRDIELDNIVSKYRAMKADYERGQRDMKQKLNWLPGHIADLKESIARGKELIAARQDTSGDKFSITLGKKTITKRDEADKYIKKLAEEGYTGKLGTFAGIDISLGFNQRDYAILIGGTDFVSEPSISSLEHRVRNLERNIEQKEEQLRRVEKELSDTQKTGAKPFEYEKELQEAEAESKEIKARLLKTNDPIQEAAQEIDQAMAETGEGLLNTEATRIATGTFETIERVKRAIDILFGRDDNVQASDAAVERVLNATKSPLNIKGQIKESISGVGRALKDLFDYEWTVKNFPGFQNDLRLFKGVSRDSQKFALDMTLKILKPLHTAREFEIFRRLVFLRDLEQGVKEAEPDATGVAKNIGLTEDQIKATQKELWELAAKMKGSDTRIKMALWAHDKVYKAMWEDLKIRGKVSPDAAAREHYVPHRVLDYMNDVDRRFPNLSKRFKTPYRYYLKGRTGSQRLIDTDYVGITLRHFAKLFMDNATDDFNIRIATKFDQNRKLTKGEKAKLYGKKKVPVPGKLYEYKGKRYVGWQYDPGRQMYPVEIVTEDTAKRFIAVGRYKKTYLLPVEIADRLTHFKDVELNSHVLNALRKANSLWKQILFSPVTLGLPFQTGNFIGDVLNLYVSDAPALRYLAKGWKAAKQWQKGQVDKDLEELVRLAEQSRVMESTFMREAGMPYDPKLAKLQPRRYLLRKFNPFVAWSDVAERRELAPRLAKMYADLQRIDKGEMPQSTAIDTEDLNKNGMSTREIAGKLAREVTVDYHKMNGETQRVLRDLLFPMLAFWYGNFPNWFKYAKRSPLNLAVKVLLPMLIMTLWNWMKFKDTEEKLPGYYRVMPHIITGWKDKEGKPIIIALQTPFDMATRMIGLDETADIARRIQTGKISWDEGVKELGENLLFSPWEDFKDFLTPFIKAPIEAAMNKSWFNGRKIVPERLIGTEQDLKLRLKYVVEQWVSPIGNWSRQQEGIILESVRKYFTKGPADLPRAFGVRHVDLGREQLNRFYDRLSELEGENKDYQANLRAGRKGTFKELGQYRLYSRTATAFSTINKRINQIRGSTLPRAEKDRQIKALQQQMYRRAELLLSRSN